MPPSSGAPGPLPGGGVQHCVANPERVGGEGLGVDRISISRNPENVTGSTQRGFTSRGAVATSVTAVLRWRHPVVSTGVTVYSERRGKAPNCAMPRHWCARSGRRTGSVDSEHVPPSRVTRLLDLAQQAGVGAGPRRPARSRPSGRGPGSGHDPDLGHAPRAESSTIPHRVVRAGFTRCNWQPRSLRQRS
jgi:hypothetical protein